MIFIELGSILSGQQKQLRDIPFPKHQLPKNVNSSKTVRVYKKCPHFSGKCPRTRFARFAAFLMSVITFNWNGYWDTRLLRIQGQENAEVLMQRINFVKLLVYKFAILYFQQYVSSYPTLLLKKDPWGLFFVQSLFLW